MLFLRLPLLLPLFFRNMRIWTIFRCRPRLLLLLLLRFFLLLLLLFLLLQFFLLLLLFPLLPLLPLPRSCHFCRHLRKNQKSREGKINTAWMILQVTEHTTEKNIAIFFANKTILKNQTEELPAQKLVIQTGKGTLVGKDGRGGGYQEGVRVVAGMVVGVGLAVSLWRMAVGTEKEIEEESGTGEERKRQQHALNEIFLFPSQFCSDFPSSSCSSSCSSSSSSSSLSFISPNAFSYSTAPLSLLSSSIAHLNLSLSHHTMTHNSLAFLQRSLPLSPPSPLHFITKMNENQKLAGELEERMWEEKGRLLAENLPNFGWTLPCKWDWLASSSSPSSPLAPFEALLFHQF